MGLLYLPRLLFAALLPSQAGTRRLGLPKPRSTIEKCLTQVKNMKALRAVPLFMLLAGCSNAEEPAADSCSNALTTMEINACAAAQQEQTEAQLNAVYQQLMDRLAEPDSGLDDPGSVREQVRAAQRLWIDFRKADCDAQFALYAGGSIRTAVYLGCMQTRAAQRITELESYFPY